MQIPVDEEGSSLLVIIGHKGLFQYNCLPFREASALGIFQQLIESVLQSCDVSAVFLDDIAVTGATDEDIFGI